MKSNTFKEYIQPVVVLVAICLVITFALAFVNGITAPIIEENAKRAAEAARIELLPSATSFEQYTGDLLVYTPDAVFVTDCYTSNDGGMVVTVSTKSFGGALVEMVGIDANGAITGVKVMSHADTKGLGTKAHDAAYVSQYAGVDTLANAENIKGESAVGFISGATISSNGVYQGVCAALEQFKAVGGAK
ncbi:MAG: FMN-binding protein [Firmicutes bacterium]|nr:FMN-binding protein [Bacillota bacterium]MBR6584897.1 FMN-binding protein [Bacillota bacterium]